VIAAVTVAAARTELSAPSPSGSRRHSGSNAVPLTPTRLRRLYHLFVTNGGGGVVQPAIVARASTAMIARAAFFIFESSVP